MAKTAAEKASHTRRQKRLRMTDPVFRAKYAARSRARNAISKGKVRRLPCEVCGLEPAEAHHDDYGRPLDVRFLCGQHHRAWHAANDPNPNGHHQFRGEAHPSAKLTADVVRLIRLSDLPYPKLAAAHGVSLSTIKAIRVLKRWRHI